MKKALMALAAMAMLFSSASAQEKSPVKYKLYGFFRNFMIFDTRDSHAGTLDLYDFAPKDEVLNINGDDANANSSFRFLALTTRLGLDISGYQFGSTKFSGKVETDFYSMNGSTATLRLRQAFIKAAWDQLGASGDNSASVTIGQAWHPMASDMPMIVSLETGAPFGPFSRTPLIQGDYNIGKNITLTAAMIYGMQYLPTGPNGKSADYMKYGKLPEIYAGITFKGESGITGKLGVDIFSIKPRWKNALGTKVSDRMTNFSPFAFIQYSGKDGFLLKAKAIYASAGEHMNLLTGYGVSSINTDGSYDYTPQRSLATWVSAQYGKKWQVMGMLGYMKLFGTAEDLVSTDMYYFNGSGDKNVNQMVRVCPTIQYNAGKFQFAIEYNMTTAQYGKHMGLNGLSQDDLHWVTNHRIMNVVKFNF